MGDQAADAALTLANELEEMATTSPHCPITAAVKWLRHQHAANELLRTQLATAERERDEARAESEKQQEKATIYGRCAYEMGLVFGWDRAQQLPDEPLWTAMARVAREIVAERDEARAAEVIASRNVEAAMAKWKAEGERCGELAAKLREREQMLVHVKVECDERGEKLQEAERVVHLAFNASRYAYDQWDKDQEMKAAYASTLRAIWEPLGAYLASRKGGT
jgi:hypothetical protein